MLNFMSMKETNLCMQELNLQEMKKCKWWYFPYRDFGSSNFR